MMACMRTNCEAIGSRLLLNGARADQTLTPWAARSVFRLDGFPQVNACQVGNGGQPGDDIGELFGLVLVVSLAQCSCQFADFFHQPHERSVNSTLLIFFKVHVSNFGLEIRERHVGR